MNWLVLATLAVAVAAWDPRTRTRVLTIECVGRDWALLYIKCWLDRFTFPHLLEHRDTVHEEKRKNTPNSIARELHRPNVALFEFTIEGF